MKRIIIAFILLAAILMLPGFFVNADPVDTEFRLSWSVPFPGSITSSLEKYSLRYSSDPDSLSSYFLSCSEVPGLPVPGVPGSKDSVIFNIMVEVETDYYFAIKIQSDKGYWSQLSNVHVENVPDSAAPSPVRDLGRF